MFGNLQGWIISAVMLLATAGTLVVLAQPPKESVPNNTVPLAFKPIQLPVSADAVEPAPTADCDAAEPYREAIDLYLQDPAPYQGGARADLPERRGVTLILDGAKCARMHLFETNPTQAIGYGAKPWMEAIMNLGQATNNAGLWLRNDHPDDALKYFVATFELGRKLFEERVSWDEVSRGMSLMTAAAEQMTELANRNHDGPRVDMLQKFAQKVNQYHTDLQDKVASPLGNPVESYAAQYSGDVFAAAKNVNVERPWRVAAILHLGHYRWNVADGNKGDQIWAPKELDALDKSPDPKNQDIAIKTAIHEAQNLTLDQQRMTGGG
ncbi:MAG TPA: hypothetical protein VGI81_11520 [Tepidisphaeraceae bacterium]|jgi:hypothetical protein